MFKKGDKVIVKKTGRETEIYDVSRGFHRTIPTRIYKVWGEDEYFYSDELQLVKGSIEGRLQEIEEYIEKQKKEKQAKEWRDQIANFEKELGIRIEKELRVYISLIKIYKGNHIIKRWISDFYGDVISDDKIIKWISENKELIINYNPKQKKDKKKK